MLRRSRARVMVLILCEVHEERAVLHFRRFGCLIYGLPPIFEISGRSLCL